jgi:glycosyltransferase involved in cell wall biosynthesis
MIILHVVAPSEIGGLERVVEMLAAGQVRAGHDVHTAVVVDPGGANHPLLQTLAAGGVMTHPLVLPNRAYRQERAAIQHLCRALRPDVVHTHGYRPDVLDAAPARREGIPTVTTVHGFTAGDWKNRLYERLQRRAYRKFDAVVVVSRPLREQLIRDHVAAERVHVVQNAWQENGPPFDPTAARRSLGVNQTGFRIGWVGRLSAEKGADVLLDALPRLNDVPLGVSLVGSGREQRALQERAARLRIDQHIDWHGTIPDAGRYLPAFDVLVLSSRTEGTPIVLFEAMAAGVPIVATRVGGVPDLVSPEEATLVPSQDPPALAAAIRAIYSDPAAARARAERARARLSEFQVPPWVHRYDAIYRRVRERPSLTAMAV